MDFDEDVDYEVERIVDVCLNRDKTREFLIRLKGHRSDYDSWLPEDQLNCADLIAAFMAAKLKRDSSKVPVQRSLRKSLKAKRKRPKPVDRFVVDTKSKKKNSSRGTRLSHRRKQRNKK